MPHVLHSESEFSNIWEKQKETTCGEINGLKKNSLRPLVHDSTYGQQGVFFSTIAFTVYVSGMVGEKSQCMGAITKS